MGVHGQLLLPGKRQNIPRGLDHHPATFCALPSALIVFLLLPPTPARPSNRAASARLLPPALLPPALLQNISYKDKSLKLESKADRVVVKEEQKVETEKEALAQVGGWPGCAGNGTAMATPCLNRGLMRSLELQTRSPSVNQRPSPAFLPAC